MASITEVSIKRPLLITVIFVCLILFGFISYNNLNYNLLPKFDVPVVLVQTVYPGASSEEVESSVTKEIEEAISSVEGLKRINATSREGVSIVTIELNQSADPIEAQREAERLVSQVMNDLPEDIQDPIVSRFSLDDLPIISLTATSDLPSTEFYHLVDNKIKPLLTNIEGVAQINLIGGIEREIEIHLDNAKLAAYGINPMAIQTQIARSGMSFPVGSIENQKSQFTLRLDAKLSDLNTLQNLIIRQNPDGSKIYLKDVASITDGNAKPTTLNRINGQPGIGIQVLKQTDANTVSVAHGVKERLENIKERYTHVGFNYLIASDQSIFTIEAADGVIFDLFLAVIIVALVMVFFLHSVRSSLFVLVAIPTAMIPTFIMMWAFGYSLNLMTLMALSLVVGILVDDSIVVLENIYRHMEMGKHKRIAALEGRNEIGFTSLSITLVDVVVFIPLALSSGLIGNILREFSMVVVFSTLLSLIVAFTLTPMLASRWGRIEDLTKNTWWSRLNAKFEGVIDVIREMYVSALKWSLKRQVVIAVIITGLFISTVILLPLNGFISPTFMQQTDRGELSFQIDLPPQTPLKETNQTISNIEKMLLSNPDVEKVFSNIGTQSGMGAVNAASNGNVAEITVQIVDRDERDYSSIEFGQRIRDSLTRIPGLQLVVLPVGLVGNDIPIQIVVKGTEEDSVQAGAKQLFSIVKGVSGTDFVRYSTKSPKKEIAIHIDREKASLYGLTVAQIGATVQLAFQGNDDTQFKDKGEEYDVNITLNRADQYTVEDVKNLTIQNAMGNMVRLTDVANVYQEVGQSIRERMDRLTAMKIYASLGNRSLGDVVNDINEEISKTDFPVGTEVEFLGAAENMQQSMESLLLSLGLGVLLIYFIMVALYESLYSPFVVLFAIPVSFVGAFLTLALTMNQLSIFAMLGLIMLLGLVTKNAILIVDFVNMEIERGKSVYNALIEAGKDRLRPVMMTTLAMVFGMLPIALASGAGASIKNGMAWVIIGGLTSSMLLTIFLVPGIYYMFYKIRVYFKRRRSNKKAITN